MPTPDDVETALERIVAAMPGGERGVDRRLTKTDETFPAPEVELKSGPCLEARGRRAVGEGHGTNLMLAADV